MSSMRNAVQRRNHKERAQPLERDKWGILEKPKDYVLRAKDYNEKKKLLKILQEKASERNPDEFHFAMMSSKTHNGGQKVADRGNKSLSMDSAKLLKTQDVGYLRIMVQKTRRAREKMEQELSLGLEKDTHGGSLLIEKDTLGDRQHVIFVGNREEQKSFHLEQGYKNGTRATHGRFPTPRHESEREVKQGDEEDNDETSLEYLPASRKCTESEALAVKAARAFRKRHKRNEETRKAKLAMLKNREKDLITTEQELEHQRARMSSSVGGVTKAGLKWKVRERQR